MKLKEIMTLALQRIGEREGNRQVDNVLLSGINSAYKIIATKNKLTKTVIIDAELNTPLKLPTDFIGMEMVLKEGFGGGRLSGKEYIINSDMFFLINPDMVGELNIVYNFVPNDLKLPTDKELEPSIQSAYHSALAAYAAYYYYNNKGNFNAAQMCLNEFNSITGLAEIVKIESENQINK